MKRKDKDFKSLFLDGLGGTRRPFKSDTSHSLSVIEYLYNSFCYCVLNLRGDLARMRGQLSVVC